MTVYEIGKQLIDLRGVHLQGIILDIGGGGEGVISRLCGNGVIAIEKRRDELLESPDIGLKIVMDACNMGFLDSSFANVTCFFSLMYKPQEELTMVLSEAYRVLKPGGQLSIWDAVMPPIPKADVLLVPLTVVVSNKLTLTPTYGVGWCKGQSADLIWHFCLKAGFELESIEETDRSFMICLKKNY